MNNLYVKPVLGPIFKIIQVLRKVLLKSSN